MTGQAAKRRIVSTIDEIAEDYLSEHGDPREALRAAIADALADLCERERRLERACRLVSRGYARGRIELGEAARS